MSISPPTMKVDIKSAQDVECEECSNNQFVPVFLMKRVPALLSPTGKDTMIPIQVFKCDKCSHINELFLDGLTN